MIERNVNIVWTPDPGQTFGYVSIFRPKNSEHEAELMKPNEFSDKGVGLSSPLACPIAEVANPMFCEKMGFVPTWVGMEVDTVE